MLKFVISKDAKGEYRWNLWASNGQMLATSAEGYKAKSNCKAGIEAVRMNAANADVQDTSPVPAKV